MACKVRQGGALGLFLKKKEQKFFYLKKIKCNRMGKKPRRS
jgi:hypothetical protein